jgi:hypothetical protein
MKWRPIEEYRAEMGRVVVWLEWLEYSGRNMGTSGVWQPAYKMQLNDGSIWVEEHGCIPMETVGRRVTHFVRPRSPESETLQQKVTE